MLLYRLASPAAWAVDDGDGLRLLADDPLATRRERWRPGRPAPAGAPLAAPVAPGKIVGIGRNYAGHARELDNPVPGEPLLFLKAPSSVIGPGAAVRLPPESARVEFEGEVGLVVGRRLTRADAAEAAAAILGVTAACDVTARDLQRRDATFARAKSFDTFCPVGPAILLEPELAELEVVTRLDGAERQRGHARQMLWGPVELLVYASRMMTLEPGDLVLTGTPAGVGPLAAGVELEVEVSGVPPLRCPVEALRPAGGEEL